MIIPQEKFNRYMEAYRENIILLRASQDSTGEIYKERVRKAKLLLNHIDATVALDGSPEQQDSLTQLHHYLAS